MRYIKKLFEFIINIYNNCVDNYYVDSSDIIALVALTHRAYISYNVDGDRGIVYNTDINFKKFTKLQPHDENTYSLTTYVNKSIRAYNTGDGDIIYKQTNGFITVVANNGIVLPNFEKCGASLSVDYTRDNINILENL